MPYYNSHASTLIWIEAKDKGYNCIDEHFGNKRLFNVEFLDGSVGLAGEWEKLSNRIGYAKIITRVTKENKYVTMDS